eukprot:scaffold9594_cov56-Phaeocystis_antarctica.AAC.7
MSSCVASPGASTPRVSGALMPSAPNASVPTREVSSTWPSASDAGSERCTAPLSAPASSALSTMSSQPTFCRSQSCSSSRSSSTSVLDASVYSRRARASRCSSSSSEAASADTKATPAGYDAAWRRAYSRASVVLPMPPRPRIACSTA